MLRSLIQSDETPPSTSDERILVRAAAGYPMVLELLVQDWKASGDKSLALSLDAMTADFRVGGPAQTAYHQIMDRITRRLDSVTHNVLNLASVLGHRLNDLGMYAIVDLSAAQTMTGMAELVNRRVLRDGAQGLEFVNELARAAAYGSVTPSLRRVLHANIADSFIQQHHGGRTELALEIAWHCLRAGRTAEATPFLLHGAREAIVSGAPAAAERALATALPHLPEPSRTEALVLLAEALQEQSRWEESLRLLDRIDLCRQSRSADQAFVLITKARRRLGYISCGELPELPARLLAFVKSPADKTSRIRAAAEAASIIEALRCSTLVPSMLEGLEVLEEAGLDLDDRAHLLLAKALLFYRVNAFDLSLRFIHEAIELLETHNTPNSVLAMLQNGLGAILTKQGSYAESISAYKRGYQTALRVGNDRIYLQASANLALSLMRLGDYENAIAWGERALEQTSALLNLGFGFQASEGAVLSYAMLGRTTKADELIRRVREELEPHGWLGISQAWALYSADGYLLMRMMHQAEAEGRRATEGINADLHVDFCAGPYARWVARGATSPVDLADAYSKIDSLTSSIENYDAIDQADILNARCWLDSRTGHLSDQQLQAMLARLERLPGAVGDQLRRMGMLDFCD
jgi:tetratricopeptide (TPR) repeat protein